MQAREVVGRTAQKSHKRSHITKKGMRVLGRQACWQSDSMLGSPLTCVDGTHRGCVSHLVDLRGRCRHLLDRVPHRRVVWVRARLARRVLEQLLQQQLVPRDALHRLDQERLGAMCHADLGGEMCGNHIDNICDVYKLPRAYLRGSRCIDGVYREHVVFTAGVTKLFSQKVIEQLIGVLEVAQQYLSGDMAGRSLRWHRRRRRVGECVHTRGSADTRRVWPTCPCEIYLCVCVALVILFVHLEEGRKTLENAPDTRIFQLVARVENSVVDVIQKVPVQSEQMFDRGKNRVDLHANARVKPTTK